MKRKADAILISDLHLTDTTPVARTDDYMEAQARALAHIQALQKEHDCVILCAGDVFDKWKASLFLCRWAYHHLPQPMVTIPGNHDLPAHSSTLYEKSALSLLETVSSGLTVVDGTYEIKGRNIRIVHELIWETSAPSWSNARTAKDLIREYGSLYDLILVGDNHQSFVVTSGDTVLVNPGSMMRMTANQIEHKPTCYLYYADTNKVSPSLLPEDASNVLVRAHIDALETRDARIEAYISQMNGGEWESGLSFRRNLQGFFEINKTPGKVRDIVWTSLET